MPIVVWSHNRGLRQVAMTAPGEWPRMMIGERLPAEDLKIILCEERTFDVLPAISGPRALVVFDSVRKPDGFFEQFSCPVFTLDAPARGAQWLYTPVNPATFAAPYYPPREIPAIFIGRTSYRHDELKMLERAGVQVISTDQWRPYGAYVDALKRARVVVNLCRDRVTAQPQLKGRVIETLMAGALLLEQSNAVTRAKLPRNSYFAWSSEDDLRYLIKEAGRLRDTAEKGADYAKQFLNAENFWRAVTEDSNLLD